MNYQPRPNGAIIFEQVVSATVINTPHSLAVTATVLCLCKKEGRTKSIIKFLRAFVRPSSLYIDPNLVADTLQGFSAVRAEIRERDRKARLN